MADKRPWMFHPIVGIHKHNLACVRHSCRLATRRDIRKERKRA